MFGHDPAIKLTAEIEVRDDKIQIVAMIVEQPARLGPITGFHNIVIGAHQLVQDMPAQQRIIFNI
jgi:hypothetical protein